MQSEFLMGRLRCFGAFAFLIGLGIFLGWRRASPAYWTQLRAPLNTAFSFDPGYKAFLDAVRAETPPDATIRLIVPVGELYTIQGAYSLVPRRVLWASTPGDSSFTAIYRPEPFPMPPGGQSMPGGVLVRR